MYISLYIIGEIGEIVVLSMYIYVCLSVNGKSGEMENGKMERRKKGGGNG